MDEVEKEAGKADGRRHPKRGAINSGEYRIDRFS
jgi:hypothetical protein